MRGAGPRAPIALVWVALGAIPGALLRWALANTLAANTLGCFVLGASGLLDNPQPRRRLLVGIGFAGSLTTFSTWVVELTDQLHRGHQSALLLQILRDGAFGLGGILLGAALHHRMSGLRARQIRR